MHPIIAALKHHKTAVVLVALEIALTCAIVSNALFVIGDHIHAMQVTTGVAENELVWARSSGVDGPDNPASRESRTAADVAALRSMPGVKNVAVTNALPLSGNYWRGDISLRPGDDTSIVENVDTYVGTPGVVATLGITLLEGRDFLPQEYVPYGMSDDSPSPTAVIVSKAMAEKLWPGEDPLGKPIYFGKDASRVVGVAAHLLNPVIEPGIGNETNVLLPASTFSGGMYVLRTAPQARDAVLRDLPKVLDGVDDQRIITASKKLSDTIDDYFHDDRALIWLLLVVIGCLLALTALGVVGLSSFWVQQRTRQIGIRRAIGATRRDIVKYFLAENLMIVGVGIAVGSLSAVGLNLWLMKHYELPHMPLWVLLIGAPMLWVLGLLSALGPALRAAAVPPVVATRSV